MTEQWPPENRPPAYPGNRTHADQPLSGVLRTAGLPVTTGGNTIGGTMSEERDHGSGGVRPWDVPPKWDGTAPETQLEPFLRALKAWLMTTRVPLKQQGVVLMTHLGGDLRTIAAELEISEVTGESCGEKIYALIEQTYQWTTIRNPPAKFEAALFSQSGQRSKGESLLSYTARKIALLKELKRAGVDLPSPARGLTVLRDARLSKAEQDAVLFWTRGEYDEEVVVDSLRRLERPGGIMGQTAAIAAGAGAVFWNEEEQDQGGIEYEEEEQAKGTGMDDEATWWQGAEEEVLTEDQAHIILAQGYSPAPGPPRPSYGQARQQNTTTTTAERISDTSKWR
eukprot:611384-Amphidinium_carterae.4